MSARDAFTETIVPRTTFVGGVSPWPAALYVHVPKKSHKKKSSPPISEKQEDMRNTEHVTAHLGNSPFTVSQRPVAKDDAAPARSATRKAAASATAPTRTAPPVAPTPNKRSGPPKGMLCRGRVDMAALKIESGIPLPSNRISGSYAEKFSQMKPKDCITCKPEEVMPVCNSLRKWLKDTGKIEQFQIVSVKHCDDDQTRGRVWLWPKGDVKELPPMSRGGVVRGAQRKGAGAKS